MLCKDVMSGAPVTAGPLTGVREVARLMVEHRVSAVPIVNASGTLIGIVSEGDLLRRPEIGTEHRRSWLGWVFLHGEEARARDFIHEHGRRAEDIMSAPVVTVTEDSPLAEAAQLMERRRIRRVVVVREGKPVGIVARADLLRTLAGQEAPPALADDQLRLAIEATMEQTGLFTPWVKVTVKDGIVELWGQVTSPDVRNAVAVAAEEAPGVKEVRNHLTLSEPPQPA